MGRGHRDDQVGRPRARGLGDDPLPQHATPVGIVRGRLAEAMRAAGLPDMDPIVRRARDGAFDYQANGVLAGARRAGLDPDAAAEQVAAVLVADPAFASVTATRGFVNVRLADAVLDAELTRLRDHPRAGVEDAPVIEATLVDYSGPNVAKEMHVGHLRSTIIGDSLARVLAEVGQPVTKRNHLGDWGTPMGMLVEYAHQQGLDISAAPPGSVSEWYASAKATADADPAFMDAARARTVQLQAGDSETTRIWQQLRENTFAHLAEMYERLDVDLPAEATRGESAYNDALPGLVQRLLADGIARESDGAIVVDVDGQDAPLIIRKADGGYLYGTTDLAAIAERDAQGQRRVLYVTDARQADHFAAIAQVAKTTGRSARVEHVGFGMVMGPDGKPYKSRDGGTVKLSELLGEAEDLARVSVDERSPDLSEQQRATIARDVSVAAIKYADLSNTRIKNYRYDPEGMVRFTGDTGPYLQYAHRRAAGVVERVAAEGVHPGTAHVREDAERTLALRLSEYPAAVHEVADTAEPHRLCAHLHEIATSFTRFYETCPVKGAPDAATRESRAALCAQTAATLQRGLGLLGIRTLDRM